MATIVAVRSGNWSDTSHVTGPWPGASTPTTKPGVGDTVQTAGFVVTIDEDVTVSLLESTSSGYFQVTDAPTLPAVRTITAAVLNSGTALGALQVTNPSGLVVWPGGDITGGANDDAYGIYNDGTIGNVTGDITGGAGHIAHGIYNVGTMGNITGDITGGAGNNVYGIYNVGTMGNITGDITGGAGNNVYGIYNEGTIGDVIGDVTGGAVTGAWGIYSEGTIGNVTGDVTGGAGDYAWGIYNVGGTIGDVTGDVTGGAGNVAQGIHIADGGTMGDVDGSLICGPNGLFPIQGSFKMVANPANSITVRQPNGDPWTLSNDYPAEADVKDGVDYNRGTMTGELAAGGTIGPVSIVIGGGGIRIF